MLLQHYFNRSRDHIPDEIHRHRGEKRGSVDLSVMRKDVTTVVSTGLKHTTSQLLGGHRFHYTMDASHPASGLC